MPRATASNSATAPSSRLPCPQSITPIFSITLSFLIWCRTLGEPANPRQRDLRQAARPGDLQQSVEIEVSLEVRREPVQCRLHLRLVGQARGGACLHPREVGGAEAVIREEAMQIAAGN